MATPLSPRARRWSSVALALAVFLGVGSFEPAPPPDELLVFAMSVETGDGRLIGSPVVVGAPGHRVEVSLRCERNPDLEKMSVVLDPLEPAADGALRYSYSLDVPGRLRSERGTVELTPGREQSIAVRPNDARRSVRFALYAAPVSHPGNGRYLKGRRLRLGPAES